MDWLLRTEQYWIRRYIRALRKEEFYMNYKRNKILQYYFSRKKNLLGIRLRFFINAGCFDIGLKIYQSYLLRISLRKWKKILSFR